MFQIYQCEHQGLSLHLLSVHKTGLCLRVVNSSSLVEFSEFMQPLTILYHSLEWHIFLCTTIWFWFTDQQKLLNILKMRCAKNSHLHIYAPQIVFTRFVETKHRLSH